MSAIAFVALAAPCGQASAQTPNPALLKNLPPVAPATLKIVPEFRPGAAIPKKFAMRECGGQNVSPRLRWSGAPPRTKSYLVTITDSQEDNAFHWIVADIPASTTTLPANAGARALPAYGRYAKNSFGHARYDGPCPPRKSTHHYVVAVYALNVPHLPIEGPVDVLQMTAGHILAEVTTLGSYSRR